MILILSFGVSKHMQLSCAVVCVFYEFDQRVLDRDRWADPATNSRNLPMRGITLQVPERVRKAHRSIHISCCARTLNKGLVDIMEPWGLQLRCVCVCQREFVLLMMSQECTTIIQHYANTSFMKKSKAAFIHEHEWFLCFLNLEFIIMIINDYFCNPRAFFSADNLNKDHTKYICLCVFIPIFSSEDQYHFLKGEVITLA